MTGAFIAFRNTAGMQVAVCAPTVAYSLVAHQVGIERTRTLGWIESRINMMNAANRMVRPTCTPSASRFVENAGRSVAQAASALRTGPYGVTNPAMRKHWEAGALRVEANDKELAPKQKATSTQQATRNNIRTLAAISERRRSDVLRKTRIAIGTRFKAPSRMAKRPIEA